jgi:hypothetical protein|tara:strand:- start:71 stop:1192 length:1122 start_codon:yes stop_codon:yes gene_type:complete
MTKEQLEHAYSLYKTVTNNKSEVSRIIKKTYNIPNSIDSIRKKLDRHIYEQESTGLLEECEKVGIPFDKVKYYWYKGQHYSINVKGEDGVSYEEIREELIESMKEHAPEYPTIVRSDMPDGHLLVIDPADVHIGKLATAMESGDDYDSNIAVKRVREGVQGILDKTIGYNIEQILFIGGNDILHIDTPDRKTTKGTSQDTDRMWYENFLMAKKIYVETLEKLMRIADVHFMYNPSNHDYTNGFFLADTITSWFHKCPHITFDVSIAHRKYYHYGNNLIGTTHGDAAKATDLPLLMAHEAKEEWAKSKHRYVYTHHVHHKTSKDYGSVNVESLRSPSGTDSWHHKMGHQHAPKAIEGFLHHPKHGQIARLTHLF